MKESYDTPPARVLRWIARMFGTLLGLIVLMELIDRIGHISKATMTRDFMYTVGFFLVLSGCIVGWFKEFAASLLFLGGTALLYVSALLASSPLGAYLLHAVPALSGLLFLWVHFATKKR